MALAIELHAEYFGNDPILALLITEGEIFARFANS